MINLKFKQLNVILILALALICIQCEKDSKKLLIEENETEDVTSSLKSAPTGLTSHFQNWLNSNGYSSYDFLRNDISGGSFGGKISSGDVFTKQPVIFIHGNSDKALGSTIGQTGWTESRNYFLAQGYTNAELYGFTWGPANMLLSSEQYHSYDYISHVRAFIQAVKQYTGASKVDIITHSMGVTLARKAIKGGSGYDSASGGNYNLGSSITNYIDTFVGIAGANKGLVSCYQCNGMTKTCNKTNGLYPGYLWWGTGPYGVSDFLVDLNSSSGYEGSHVFTIWSTVDELIGYGCLVYGQYTTRIPGQDGEKVYYSVPYGHFNSKDLTESVQYNMVVNHVPN